MSRASGILIFILGVAVGAVGGTYLTYRKVTEIKDDEMDREINGMRDYYDYRLHKLKEQYQEVGTDEEDKKEPPKELSKSSYEEYIKEHQDDDDENKVRYNHISTPPKEEKTEFIQVYHVIDEDEYDDEDDGRKKEMLFLFTDENDEKIVVNEDENFIDFRSLKEAYESAEEDVFYVRDVVARVDYKVDIRPEEYFKGIVDDILAVEEG